MVWGRHALLGHRLSGSPDRSQVGVGVRLGWTDESARSPAPSPRGPPQSRPVSGPPSPWVSPRTWTTSSHSPPSETSKRSTLTFSPDTSSARGSSGRCYIG